MAKRKGIPSSVMDWGGHIQPLNMDDQDGGTDA